MSMVIMVILIILISFSGKVFQLDKFHIGVFELSNGNDHEKLEDGEL
jgi:hypothetical protein